MERLISGSYQTIHQYEPGYTPAIFSGVLWANSAPRQATQALHTIRESRTLGGITYNLPPATYTYDDLYLVQVENGYGGKIEDVYDETPWVSNSSDASNFLRSMAIATCY